jgi:hypothetical protein
LTKVQSDVLRLDQRVLTLQKTLGEAMGALSVQEQRSVPSPREITVPTYRLMGQALKTNTELSAKFSRL